jgi:hypothetical protein
MPSRAGPAKRRTQIAPNAEPRPAPRNVAPRLHRMPTGPCSPPLSRRTPLPHSCPAGKPHKRHGPVPFVSGPTAQTAKRPTEIAPNAEPRRPRERRTQIAPNAEPPCPGLFPRRTPAPPVMHGGETPQTARNRALRVPAARPPSGQPYDGDQRCATGGSSSAGTSKTSPACSDRPRALRHSRSARRTVPRPRLGGLGASWRR